jgi:hypothetical protein
MGADSHTNALHRVRGALHISHVPVALTLAAGLVACNSSRAFRSSPRPAYQAPSRSTASDPPREEAQPPPPASSARAPAEPPGPGSTQSPTSEPQPAASLAAAPSPSAGVPSDDPLERQFEILNEAVAALRKEVARSYDRAQDLGTENERLHALIASLRRDLGKSRRATKSLTNRLQALEKRLHEISSPPPQATTATETRVPPTEMRPAAAPTQPSPTTAPPSPSPSPLPSPDPAGATGATDSTAPPEDTSDQ